MKSMKEIFIRKYEEASGKKCDETILSHMQYALQAGEEYAENRVTKALKPWNEFMDKLEDKVNEDTGTDDIGEFVMDYFDLWL